MKKYQFRQKLGTEDWKKIKNKKKSTYRNNAWFTEKHGKCQKPNCFASMCHCKSWGVNMHQGKWSLIITMYFKMASN